MKKSDQRSAFSGQPVGVILRRGWGAKFGSALRGVRLGVSGQSSFVVHGICAVGVIVAAFVWPLTWLERGVLALCIATVLSAEMFNSALETLAKAIDQKQNPHIADGLDIASAAVLLMAIGAAVVGATIFLYHWGWLS